MKIGLVLGYASCSLLVAACSSTVTRIDGDSVAGSGANTNSGGSPGGNGGSGPQTVGNGGATDCASQLDGQFNALGVDPQGGAIMAGVLTQSSTIGTTDLQLAGGTDVLLAKVDASCNVVWAKRFGDVSDQTAYAIAVDSKGGFAITGTFYGDLDFGAGPLHSDADISEGWRQGSLFVARFGADGELIWATDFDGASRAEGTRIVFAPDGGLIVSGDLQGSVNFGGGPLKGEAWTGFVLALDADGGYVWATPMGDSEEVRSLAVDDAGDVYFTTALFTAKLWKLDPSFNLLWKRELECPGPCVVFADTLVTDHAGHVFMAGDHQGPVHLGNGVVVEAPAATDGNFIAAFDAEGNALWGRAAGDRPYQPDPTSLAVDGAGNLVLTGSFSGVLDFGIGALTTSAVETTGATFVASFDANGNPGYSRRFGGISSNAVAVAASPLGGVDVMGLFVTELDLGNGITLDGGGVAPAFLSATFLAHLE